MYIWFFLYNFLVNGVEQWLSNIQSPMFSFYNFSELSQLVTIAKLYIAILLNYYEAAPFLINLLLHSFLLISADWPCEITNKNKRTEQTCINV